MMKRKFKINILDIAIVVAVICSIGTVIFRDTISEAFGKPEITTLEITFAVAEDSEEDIAALATTAELYLQLDPESEEMVKLTLDSLKSEADGAATVTVTCMGYRRLGRFYSEDNRKIEINSEYTIFAGDAELTVNVSDVSILDGE